MINLTVINFKDIIKYLVGISVIFIVTLIFTRYFDTAEISSDIVKKIDYSLIECIDTIMPILKSNKIEDEQIIKENSGEILKKLMILELGVIDQYTIPDNEIIQENLVEEIEVDLETEIITEKNLTENYTNMYSNVKIKNTSDYELGEDIFTMNIQIQNKKDIVLFHTHTCESYTPTERFFYNMTGNYRTTDLNYTVARLGTELQQYLISSGYNVIHDTTYHDYPSYSGSYERSLNTVSTILNDTKADILIDLHRDAIGDGASYAPTVKIGGEIAAQLMFVIGTSGGGLEHPNWKENLNIAIQIQQKAEELYPGLFKPILISNSRYNQHLARGASIIEVGATGNTLEQCLNSMKYLSKVIDEVLK